MDPNLAYSSATLNDLYHQTVVRERDLIMANNLYRKASEPGVGSVVAVVGANHVPGMVAEWANATSPLATTRY